MDRMIMRRVEANDPSAIREMGTRYEKRGDFVGAFGWYSRAAKLGCITAHYDLGVLHKSGQGADRDEKKELHHLAEAAIGGHPDARYDLGVKEWNKRYHRTAVKHYIIAAKHGHNEAIKRLKEIYSKMGDSFLISKEDFASALRGHQAAVNESNSSAREVFRSFPYNE